MNPKQIGPLFSLVGMIGTSAEQIMAHPDMPRKLVKQAGVVKKWADRAIDQIESIISDATVRKMNKHGHAFVGYCARQRLVTHGGESAPMVVARLMAGQYGVNHYIHRLQFKGPWKELEQTSATLLKWCLAGAMGEYEERMFKVAEAMVCEVLA